MRSLKYGSITNLFRQPIIPFQPHFWIIIYVLDILRDTCIQLWLYHCPSELKLSYAFSGFSPKHLCVVSHYILNPSKNGPRPFRRPHTSFPHYLFVGVLFPEFYEVAIWAIEAPHLVAKTLLASPELITIRHVFQNSILSTHWNSSTAFLWNIRRNFLFPYP